MDIFVGSCVGLLTVVLVPGVVVDSFVGAGACVDVLCVALVTFNVGVVDSCIKVFVVGLVSFEVVVAFFVKDNVAEVVFTVVMFFSIFGSFI